jgi:uncharacterized membrane protein (UPF0136 family)
VVVGYESLEIRGIVIGYIADVKGEEKMTEHTMGIIAAILITVVLVGISAMVFYGAWKERNK